MLTLERCTELCAFGQYLDQPEIWHECPAVCFFLEVKARNAAGQKHPWGAYVAALPETSNSSVCWSAEEVSSALTCCHVRPAEQWHLSSLERRELPWLARRQSREKRSTSGTCAASTATLPPSTRRTSSCWASAKLSQSLVRLTRLLVSTAFRRAVQDAGYPCTPRVQRRVLLGRQ